MKKFFLIFIIIFSLIGFVGCTQKDDTKSQFIKDFDIDMLTHLYKYCFQLVCTAVMQI